MKNIKISILTLSLLSFSGISVLSMYPNESDLNRGNIPISSIKYEKAGFDDNAITLDENSPIVLINKDYIHFDKGNKIIEEVRTGHITCITSYMEDHRYQLESKRFLVNSGDKLEVSYKVSTHPGGNVWVGLLNTKRTDFFGQNHQLKPGAHAKEIVLRRVVPEGETETSLLFFAAGSIENPTNSSFTIESIKIKKIQ